MPDIGNNSGFRNIGSAGPDKAVPAAFCYRMGARPAWAHAGLPAEA